MKIFTFLKLIISGYIIIGAMSLNQQPDNQYSIRSISGLSQSNHRNQGQQQNQHNSIGQQRQHYASSLNNGNNLHQSSQNNGISSTANPNNQNQYGIGRIDEINESNGMLPIQINQQNHRNQHSIGRVSGPNKVMSQSKQMNQQNNRNQHSVGRVSSPNKVMSQSNQMNQRNHRNQYSVGQVSSANNVMPHSNQMNQRNHRNQSSLGHVSSPNNVMPQSNQVNQQNHQGQYSVGRISSQDRVMSQSNQKNQQNTHNQYSVESISSPNNVQSKSNQINQQNHYNQYSVQSISSPNNGQYQSNGINQQLPSQNLVGSMSGNNQNADQYQNSDGGNNQNVNEPSIGSISGNNNNQSHNTFQPKPALFQPQHPCDIGTTCHHFCNATSDIDYECICKDGYKVVSNPTKYQDYNDGMGCERKCSAGFFWDDDYQSCIETLSECTTQEFVSQTMWDNGALDIEISYPNIEMLGHGYDLVVGDPFSDYTDPGMKHKIFSPFRKTQSGKCELYGYSLDPGGFATSQSTTRTFTTSTEIRRDLENILKQENIIDHGNVEVTDLSDRIISSDKSQASTIRKDKRYGFVYSNSEQDSDSKTNGKSETDEVMKGREQGKNECDRTGQSLSFRVGTNNEKRFDNNVENVDGNSGSLGLSSGSEHCKEKSRGVGVEVGKSSSTTNSGGGSAGLTIGPVNFGGHREKSVTTSSHTNVNAHASKSDRNCKNNALNWNSGYQKQKRDSKSNGGTRGSNTDVTNGSQNSNEKCGTLTNSMNRRVGNEISR
jgi:hypothetical protein